MIKDLVYQAELGKSYHQVLQFLYVCYTEKCAKSETRFNDLKRDYDKLRRTEFGV